MFITPEQKAAELLTIPNGQLSASSPPKYLADGLPNSTATSPILLSKQTDYPLSNSPFQEPLSRTDTPTNELMPQQNGGLVPGAPRNIMHSPVSKLTPMTRGVSADGGKPMLRARSHSEQPPKQDQYQRNQFNTTNHETTPLSVPAVKNVASNISSPLARRVRSATTLRPSEDDNSPLKTLMANKQFQQKQQQQQQQKSTQTEIKSKTTDSHRRSISADNATHTKKAS